MHALGTKNFEANIFVIHKALLKFTKILSHGNLEPYSSNPNMSVIMFLLLNVEAEDNINNITPV